MLRIFFKYNRRLRGELCGCALRSLTSYFAAVWGGPHTIPFPNAIFPTIDEKTASPVDPGTTISTRSMLDYDLHGRRHRGRAPEVNFVRRPIAERFVRPLFVVEPKIRSEMRPGLGDRPIFVKIDLFVLDRTPKAFDEDVVVDPAASAEGVSFRGLETGSCVYAVGSGRYEFSVDPLPRVLSARVLPAAGSR